MRNNLVYLRVLNYIEENNLTESQIKVATDQQILSVMYPDTNGVKPENENLTPQLILRALKHEYKERLTLSRKQELKTFLEEKGITVISVEHQEDNKYLVELDD